MTDAFIVSAAQICIFFLRYMSIFPDSEEILENICIHGKSQSQTSDIVHIFIMVMSF